MDIINYRAAFMSNVFVEFMLVPQECVTYDIIPEKVLLSHILQKCKNCFHGFYAANQ